MKHYSLSILQAAFNQILKLDPSLEDKLRPLSGGILQIKITPFPLEFFMQFSTLDIQLLASCERPPDAIIEGTPLGLLRLQMSSDSQAGALLNEDIKLEGNLEFGHAVKKLFAHIDLDWEYHLAQMTGDLVAYKMSSLLQQGVSFTQKITHACFTQLSDYMHEEARISPPAEELNDFYNDVDALALRVERLHARLQQINNQQDKSHD